VPKGVGPLSNSKCCYVVEADRRGLGVSSSSERGTTQTAVKVPKYSVSVRGSRAFPLDDSEEGGVEGGALYTVRAW
jgi:hypothetical protein